MTTTFEDFCDKLMADDHPTARLEPEGFAADFSAFFGLSGRPTLGELTRLYEMAGIGKVSPAKLPRDLRGVHYTLADGSYAIHYQEGQWEGSSELTVLHEGYEIFHETLWHRCHNEALEQKVCSEADRFAAAVLMPPQTFAAYAQASGLDVAALKNVFNCAYSAVAIRLGEVLGGQPLAVVLYERKEPGDPADWPVPTRLGDLRVKVVNADNRLRCLPFPAAQRLAGRRSPEGQTPLRRFVGRASGPPLRAGIRRGGRHRRGRYPRPVEMAPRQGDRCRRALGTSQGPGAAVGPAALALSQERSQGLARVRRWIAGQ